jgi:hypothetical protein
MLNQLWELIIIGHAKAANFAPVTQAGGDIKSIAKSLIDYAFVIGGGLAVIYIIYAGIGYMTAGSDTAKAEQSRNAITYAIIGMVIIALAYVIIRWTTTSIDYISVPSSGTKPNL